jgi:hypothetical protein
MNLSQEKNNAFYRICESSNTKVTHKPDYTIQLFMHSALLFF